MKTSLLPGFCRKGLASFFSVVVLSFAAGLLGGGMTVQAESVQGLAATPYNSGAVLSWTAVTGPNPVSNYEVSYGLYSVSEGLAASYDQVLNTGGTDTTYVLPDLNNGFRYYVAIRAQYADQTFSDSSEEVTVTPSSIYSALPQNAEKAAAAENDTTAPTVQSAMALTNKIIKVTFSEDVKLPDVLPELSFAVAKSDDPSSIVTVSQAEYKVDYAGAVNEDIHENIAFVTLESAMEPETDYTVTVSAAVTDQSGNPIESGVTDFATFTGTDRTEIPDEEKPLGDASLESTQRPPATTDTEAGNGTPGSPVSTADTTAPENVSNLTISAKQREKDFWLDLTWGKSPSPDVTDQKLYEGKNGGEFGPAVSLGKDVATYGLTGTPETELSYKVTAVDAAGNESSGTISSIRLPALATTGGPLVLLALGASFGLSGIKKYLRK